MSIPATVITGFLGVGKTTAIRHLLAHGDGRWAVVVNEFGEVGIDGATLADGELAVAEIPGGCICCSAGVALQVTLARVLREVRPTRLLVEPTGLAHPASVLDTLRRPGLRESLDPRATLTLVDPRHVRNPRARASATWNDQITVADVLIANKTDLCSPEDLDAFRTFAAGLWPPPLRVVETLDGAIDPALLDLSPHPDRPVRSDGHHHGHSHPVGMPTDGRSAHLTEDAATCGFIWPPERIWDRNRLRETVQTLVRPGPILPAGVLRLKGIFRTPGARLLVQADADAVRFEPIGWRRDSRLEVIAPPAPTPDWDRVEAALDEARFRPDLG